ncbi:MAG: hypothetical protein ABW004_15715 [Aeromicrobium sp.]
MRRIMLATVTALLLLAGCSSGGDSDGSTASNEPSSTVSPSATADTPTAASGPDCDDVWRAGQVLPADYTSCLDGGAAGTQDVTECTDGTSLVVYLDSFYAVTGEKIIEPDVAPLQDTEEFGAAYSACTGE